MWDGTDRRKRCSIGNVSKNRMVWVNLVFGACPASLTTANRIKVLHAGCHASQGDSVHWSRRLISDRFSHAGRDPSNAVEVLDMSQISSEAEFGYNLEERYA